MLRLPMMSLGRGFHMCGASNDVNVFHLTWIMSLYYLVKHEMLIAHVVPLSCYRKKLKNLSHLNCGLQIRQIWIQFITACEKYCKRRCTNMHHWSASIDDATDRWLLQWQHDPDHSVLSSVSVHPDQWCIFCTPSFAIVPTHSNQLASNLANLKATVKWDKFWSLFL